MKKKTSNANSKIKIWGFGNPSGPTRKKWCKMWLYIDFGVEWGENRLRGHLSPIYGQIQIFDLDPIFFSGRSGKYFLNDENKTINTKFDVVFMYENIWNLVISIVRFFSSTINLDFWWFSKKKSKNHVFSKKNLEISKNRG